MVVQRGSNLALRLGMILSIFMFFGFLQFSGLSNGPSRELLDTYPKDVFSESQLEGGAFLLHIIGVLYMFAAIAIVVDDFFVPAIEVIIDDFEISHEVAGATLMAAGGSAPELFTSFFGTFAETDVGLGTIVGSAVFNILFVIAACAFAVDDALAVTWWPLARDVSFYSFDLILLAVFMEDSVIEWYEACILLILYGVYVWFMNYNSENEKRVRRLLNLSEDKVQRTSITDLKKYLVTFRLGTMNMMLGRAGIVSRSKEHCEIECSELGQGISSSTDHRFKNASGIVLQAVIAKQHAEKVKKDGIDEGDGNDHIDMTFPDSKRGKLVYLIIAPITWSLYLTLPDCRRAESRKFYPWTFSCSIVWIGVYSWLMVWWATRIGEALNIPEAVMGLTFLAAGTSVPDLISSVIVASQGYGDMAVSSSIGSNIFDVTVGLPLPWLMYNLVNGAFRVSSNALVVSIMVLFAMLLVVIVTIAYSNWRLSKGLGLTMVLFYFVFVALNLLMEYDVIKV